MEAPSLGAFKKRVDVALSDIIQCVAGLMVGLDDPSGPSQP